MITSHNVGCTSHILKLAARAGCFACFVKCCVVQPVVVFVVSVKREDPLTLLIRYLSTMGIRVVDLFRVFDTTSNLYVSQANFIRGLKVSQPIICGSFVKLSAPLFSAYGVGLSKDPYRRNN